LSALALRAIAEAGLSDLAEARRASEFGRVNALAKLLDSADLLAVGALADQIRAEEVGDVVSVFVGASPDDGSDVVTIEAEGAQGESGRAGVLLRVARARITGPRAARVRVHWGTVGIELAQVALGFGANELAGPVLSRRGLPIADDSMRKVKGSGLVATKLLKKAELFALVRTAGRVPLEVPFAGGGKPREWSGSAP
jgi:2-iminoacetate synthase ThiH